MLFHDLVKGVMKVYSPDGTLLKTISSPTPFPATSTTIFFVLRTIDRLVEVDLPSIAHISTRNMNLHQLNYRTTNGDTETISGDIHLILRLQNRLKSGSFSQNNQKWRSWR